MLIIPLQINHLGKRSLKVSKESVKGSGKEIARFCMETLTLNGRR